MQSVLDVIQSRGVQSDATQFKELFARCGELEGVGEDHITLHFRRVRNLQRYLRDHSAEVLANHLRLLSTIDAKQLVAVDARTNGVEGGFRICVVGMDVRGVSACVSGCLASMGLSITQMDVFTYEPDSQRPEDDPEQSGNDPELTDESMLQDRYVMSFEVVSAGFEGDERLLRARLKPRLKSAYWHLVRGDIQGAWQQAETQDELIGKEFDGRFRIERQLGDGGMGTIYLATQLDLDRPVAVKVLKAELTNDQDLMESLKREGRLLARLDSPHIVTVYASGVFQDRYWIAIEYMPGGDVAHWIQRHGPPSARMAARWLHDALEGLRYIHREIDLVHGDVKPNNLLLDGGRKLHVGDLGMSQLMQLTRILRPDGRIRGTPAYMSPEQARGDRLDERSDLNSLGNSFFHVLSGNPPFTGDNAVEVITKVSRAEHPRLSDVAPQVSPGLAVIVERLMEADPLRRYQTADVALADLRSFLDKGRLFTGSTTVRPQRSGFDSRGETVT